MKQQRPRQRRSPTSFNHRYQMKRFNVIATCIATGLLLAMFSCNDPLQIGTELVIGDNSIDFFTTDTATIEALTLQRDSTIAYQAPIFLIGNQRVGWMNDPIFGSHKSSVTMQLLPESFIKPEGTVDSLVLSLRLDTIPIYGDINAPFDISLFNLQTGLDRFGTYYTDQQLVTRISVGEKFGYLPVIKDSINIVEYNSAGIRDTMRVPNQLRFKMTNALGERLLSLDSIQYTTVDTFLAAVAGLVLVPNNANNAMLPLNITLNASNKISLFYKDNADVPRQYNYLLGGAAFSQHLHDHSTGTIGSAIGDPAISRERLYLQGSGGPSISLKFPHIEQFKDVLINEAILEMTTELLPEDNRNLYPLPEQVYTAHLQDSLIVITNDVVTAVSRFGDPTLFGGSPIDDSGRVVYRMNISEHFQRMIKGEAKNELFIQLAQNSTGPHRVVFKGVDDAEFPIRLKLTYTEI